MAQAESFSRTDQRSQLPSLVISAALLIGLALLTVRNPPQAAGFEPVR